MLKSLQELFERIRRTADPAAGSANGLLIRLRKRGDQGFRFRSLEEACCNRDVKLLLDLQIAVWEKQGSGGIIRLSDSVKRTLKIP